MSGKKEESKKRKNTIFKEFILGLFALLLGGYNLLTHFKVIDYFVDIPRIVGSVLLLIVGFLLLITAFKLYRHRYYSKRLL